MCTAYESAVQRTPPFTPEAWQFDGGSVAVQRTMPMGIPALSIHIVMSSGSGLLYTIGKKGVLS